MNSGEREAYKQGFMSGMNARDHTIYTLFGIDLGKVLEIVSNHIEEQEKVKMSRPIIYIRCDAFEELKKYMNAGIADSIQTYNFIFKPERKVIDIIDCADVVIKRNGKIIYED